MNDLDVYSFLVNGYIHGRIPFIQDLNIDDYKFSHCDDDDFKYDVRLDDVALKVRTYIVTHYIDKLFTRYNLIRYNAWEGVDTPSSVWHNDLREGFNSNLIVYLDDSLNKNSIEVRSVNNQMQIFPRKGDFVWLNQSAKFQHRATHIEGNRRVLSFEFEIDDLWT